MKTFALTTSTALLLAGTASAQIFGDTHGTDMDTNRFNSGFNDSGYFNALDRDNDTVLNEGEYATGLYRTFDRDRDLRITEDEYTMGTQRYHGADYEMTPFTDYDTDGSGYLSQTEFRPLYDSGYNDDFVSFDGDGDGILTSDEYSNGLYGRADANQDMVIMVEEEGWFEGWFDGDDIEAEIESVGDVY